MLSEEPPHPKKTSLVTLCEFLHIWGWKVVIIHIVMKFCIGVGVPDIITRVNFDENLVRDFWGVGVEFPTFLLTCVVALKTHWHYHANTQRGRSWDGFSEGGYKFCEVILKLHWRHRLFGQYEISDMTSVDCVSVWQWLWCWLLQLLHRAICSPPPHPLDHARPSLW